MNDSDKKERMKYFLSEYSKPKFNINTSVYVFFITAIICFFWQNRAQQRCIEEQQQEINSLILYMIYTNPEMFPNDTIFPDMSEPYDNKHSHNDKPEYTYVIHHTQGRVKFNAVIDCFDKTVIIKTQPEKRTAVKQFFKHFFK